jgi:hypothetical protein
MKILKIDTLTGYRDKDEVMLHACFQILVNFVKHEWDDGKGWRAETFGGQHDLKKTRLELKKMNYPKDIIKQEIAMLKCYNKITKEIWDLHNWWTKTRPARDPEKVADWDKKKMDFVDDVEDCQMLARLIKVRRYLWT